MADQTTQRRPYQSFELAEDVPQTNRLHFIRALIGSITLKQIRGEEPIDPELQKWLDHVSDMNTIRQLLEVVTDDRGRSLLIARFGFDSGATRTLEACCKPFNLSRERIRQIESKSLAQIRYYGKHLLA